jgi:hypothetical protein
MNIAQLYEELSYGELSTHAMSGDGSGTILTDRKPQVLLYTNEALFRLHSRFLLRTNDVLIEMLDHITNYHLLQKFAESAWETSKEPFLYIKDLMREPYQDDCIKILEVYDSFGRALPLNDPEQPDSLYTPQNNVLQTPYPEGGKALSVGYQARHPLLTKDLPETTLIEIPDVIRGALKAYIAYGVYSGMSSDGASVTAQQHYARYEAICNEALGMDLVQTSMAQTNTRFHKNGWR